MHAYYAFDELDHSERFAFARYRFLGIRTLQSIGAFKRQLLELLASARVAGARGMPCTLYPVPCTLYPAAAP